MRGPDLRGRRRAAIVRETVLERDHTLCPLPGKETYHSKADAKVRLRRMQRIARAGLQPYRCRCGYWHLGHAKPTQAKP